jgi:hypothetical protein
MLVRLKQPGEPEQQALLYYNGEMGQVTAAAWKVYAWLPDGRFVFSSDGGETIRYWEVDWVNWVIDSGEYLDVSQFAVHSPEYPDVPELLAMPAAPLEQQRGNAVIYITNYASGRQLFYWPLPEPGEVVR